MLKEDILQLLKAGKDTYLSGQRISAQLGVSRAALFRELAALQSLGVLRSEGNLLTVLDAPALEKLLYHPSHTK